MNSTRFRISYWDGVIIGAALRAGARTLFSEALNHGQKCDGVRVVNPFYRETTMIRDSAE